MKSLVEFKNLSDIDKVLKNEKTCRVYYERLRWGNKIVCPHCGWDNIYKLKPSKYQNEYKCGNNTCYKRFNCLTETIFEATKISLVLWFKAIYLCTTLSKGISSTNLAVTLGVTQKTAWFMLHRIRLSMMEKAPEILEGVVEIDEVYIGGVDKNKHADKKSGKRGSLDDKTMVVGMVQRGGKIRIHPLVNNKIKAVSPLMMTNIKPESTIYTDKSSLYRHLKHTDYTHKTIDHTIGQYVSGEVHTNTIEGAWGLFKRKINGIHHRVSPKHLHRYCNEFSFGYNHRKFSSYEKFNEALKGSNIRLKYQELIKN